MTSLDTLLCQVEERLKKATPGPYIVQRFDNDGGDISYQIETEQVHEEDQIVAWCGELANFKRAKPNAELIAHAPTDLRRLLSIVREMRGALDATRDELFGSAEPWAQDAAKAIKAALTRCERLASGEVV